MGIVMNFCIHIKRLDLVIKGRKICLDLRFLIKEEL